MSAVEEYRKWWAGTEGWTRLEGALKARQAIAELENDNEVLRLDLGEQIMRAVQAEASVERLKWQMEAMWCDPQVDSMPNFDTHLERLDVLWARRNTP